MIQPDHAPKDDTRSKRMILNYTAVLALCSAFVLVSTTARGFGRGNVNAAVPRWRPTRSYNRYGGYRGLVDWHGMYFRRPFGKRRASIQTGAIPPHDWHSRYFLHPFGKRRINETRRIFYNFREPLRPQENNYSGSKASLSPYVEDDSREDTYYRGLLLRIFDSMNRLSWKHDKDSDRGASVSKRKRSFYGYDNYGLGNYWRNSWNLYDWRPTFLRSNSKSNSATFPSAAENSDLLVNWKGIYGKK